MPESNESFDFSLIADDVESSDGQKRYAGTGQAKPAPVEETVEAE